MAGLTEGCILVVANRTCPSPDVLDEVCDADPLQAIEDAFRQFTPVEIVISTYPPERSNWLERNVVDRARERYDITVTHIVSRYGLGGPDPVVEAPRAVG